MIQADIGDYPRSTCTFRDASAVADPTAVTVVVTTPAGTATTYTYGVDAALIKSSTGVYYIEFTITAAGDWRIKWRGTGAVIAGTDTELIHVRD